MVMVDKLVKPQACWEFEAEVLVLHHPTTISTKYQAMGQYSKTCGSSRLDLHRSFRFGFNAGSFSLTAASNRA